MGSRGVFEIVRDPADDAVWLVTVPAGHRCFDGHFDSNPVLPGVAQLAMVIEVCTAMNVGAHDRVQGFENVRFSHPVLPGSECAVSLRPVVAANAAAFQISCGERVVTAGTIVFR
jgi:3-hydroxymyristoyl/3-hydroxydecanoyl-(acyl carrier protein) dehydratase